MKIYILTLALVTSFQTMATCYPVTALSVSPDLKTAFSVPRINGGPFYEGYSWNTADSVVTGQYNGIGQAGFYATTERLKVSTDGKYLAGVADKFLVVWDLVSQKKILTLRTDNWNDEIGFFEIAGDNLIYSSNIALEDEIRDFTVINLISKKIIYKERMFKNSYSSSYKASIALSENGNILFITHIDIRTYNFKLTRIDITTGEKIEVQIKDDNPKMLVKGDILYTYGGWLRTYNTRDLILISEVNYLDYGPLRNEPSPLQISFDQNIIKLSTRTIANLKTGKTLFTLSSGFDDSFLSKDGSKFAATSRTGAVYIYDTTTWKLLSKSCADL